jgi:LacI family transcriptional regulator
MNERRVTLADIAARAKVHVTTVSLALRNHPRLPPATRGRIQGLAKQMGYAPDPFLRALVAYRGRMMPHRDRPTLAYITHWDTRWGWKKVTAHPEFYDGAERKAAELGFQLEHFWLGEPGLSHSRLSSILHARAINGVIVASHSREVDAALNLDWSHFSAVKIDYLPHCPALHNVTNDQCNIIRLAMQHVVALGYRRVGFVMHRGWDHSVDQLWSAGYLCAQQNLPAQHHIPMFLFPENEPTAAWINESKSEVVAPPDTFQRWFQTHRPEIIISKASFVWPRFTDLGLKVPRDLAFADVFLENTEGKIAGIRQNHETVGELAVEILAGQLQHNKFGVPAIPTTTFVEGTWFDGESCPRRGA